MLWPYYMWLYMKNASCLIFAYGEMHKHLAWERKVSLNSFDGGFHGFIVLFGNTKDVFCLKLYYFGKFMQNILTGNDFEDLENIVDIWLLKYLMKLLGK